MSATAPFRRNRFADRGSAAEKAVQKFLDAWTAEDPHREANRLVDSKAAGRIIKAAKADFEVFAQVDGVHYSGLIEVKETEHEYRLDRSRVTQAPSLRKRAKCGGQVYILVFHSTIRRWRCLGLSHIADASTKGSWDLRDVPMFLSPGEALAWRSLDVWGPPRG